jgi:hypothetical protein
VPAGVSLADPALFTALALYYSEHGLLFNVNGERFTDETVADHLTTMALTGQPEARGLLVGDAVTYREWITGSYVEGIPAANTFEACRRRGARCAVADDVEEFELIPEDWGYPGRRSATPSKPSTRRRGTDPACHRPGSSTRVPSISHRTT